MSDFGETKTSSRQLTLPTLNHQKSFNLITRNIFKFLMPGILKSMLDIAPKKILVISTEQLAKNPSEIMDKTYNFLELPEYKLINPQKRKSENYEKMSENTRNELINFFKPHNEKLFETINYRFDWNK